ncbi:MAG TPA: hypothetical protein VN703_04730, partial [Candidatus Sulfopaludibacter sp.]|nr:hypothetical protein [Candidatus Sulfopaludibacter sp.]
INHLSVWNNWSTNCVLSGDFSFGEILLISFHNSSRILSLLGYSIFLILSVEAHSLSKKKSYNPIEFYMCS